jgi:NTE family protein
VGAVRTNPEALMREAADLAGVAAGSKPTNEQLVKAARVLHGTGEFERVDVRTTLEDGRRVAVIDVNEKPWGPNYLRIGARAVSDFDTQASFSLTLQHTRTWVNSWGAEWRNELELGDARRLLSSFYQPLGPGSPWFVEGTVQAVKTDADIFEAMRRTDRLTQETIGAYAMAGRRLGGVGVLRFGVGHEHYKSTPIISSRLAGSTSDSATVLRAGTIFDTLDNADFPRRGYAFAADALRYAYSSDTEPIVAWQANTLLPVTFGRLTLMGLGFTQRSRDDRVSFPLGGLFSLSGTPLGAISGSRVTGLAGLAYWRMGQLRGAMGGDWYAGFSLEAGSAWQRDSPDHGETHKAASMFLGLDSIIGPIYFAYGKTLGGDSSFYLFLGRPANRGQ